MFGSILNVQTLTGAIKVPLKLRVGIGLVSFASLGPRGEGGRCTGCGIGQAARLRKLRLSGTLSPCRAPIFEALLSLALGPAAREASGPHKARSVHSPVILPVRLSKFILARLLRCNRCCCCCFSFWIPLFALRVRLHRRLPVNARRLARMVEASARLGASAHAAGCVIFVSV